MPGAPYIAFFAMCGWDVGVPLDSSWIVGSKRFACANTHTCAMKLRMYGAPGFAVSLRFLLCHPEVKRRDLLFISEESGSCAPRDPTLCAIKLRKEWGHGIRLICQGCGQRGLQSVDVSTKAFGLGQAGVFQVELDFACDLCGFEVAEHAERTGEFVRDRGGLCTEVGIEGARVA